MKLLYLLLQLVIIDKVQAQVPVNINDNSRVLTIEAKEGKSIDQTLKSDKRENKVINKFSLLNFVTATQPDIAWIKKHKFLIDDEQRAFNLRLKADAERQRILTMIGREFSIEHPEAIAYAGATNISTKSNNLETLFHKHINHENVKLKLYNKVRSTPILGGNWSPK